MRRIIKMVAVALLVIAGLSAALPPTYRWHINRRFASSMTKDFGQSGWAIVGMGADHQWGQQFHLYRTLYVRFLNPKWISCTPWKKMEFTHKTSCVIRPWHYWIKVVTKDREITCYWSIKDNEWVKIWDNSLILYWPEKRDDALRHLVGIRRVHGLNYAPEMGF